jgi:AcrR family transcriptional regulator
MEASSTYQSRILMIDRSPIPDAPLRADAARNRERILDAAETVFVERGADASLDEVAKRAGVGIGTLYRRFPTREDLLAAVCDERMLAIVKQSQERADAQSPLEAIRDYVHALVVHTTHFRGLAASLGAVLQTGPAGCQASQVEAERLLARARAAGVLRDDVVVADLVCIIVAVSLSIEQDPGSAARAGHRIDLFLGGIGSAGVPVQA